MWIRKARGPLAWWLRLLGFGGVTLPPLGIFLLPERFGDPALLRHENVHWRQYHERGLMSFYGGYLWLLCRHGYRAHPWEIEARRAEESR